MYGDRQDKGKRTFYCRRPEPSDSNDVQGCCWRTGIDYLSICKMAAWLSTLHDKEKENLIQLHLLDKSGKAPQVRLLTK